jgi:peptidoglycan/xylan/chitin deacetylase (PgdA/CDA1 family)
MKSLLFQILKLLATWLSGSRGNKKIFILIFHRVLDNPDFMRPDEIDKTQFSWQMHLLRKYFNVLPINDALQQLKTGTLPARAVCITFDDGYADNYTNALPILQENQLPALFFIASGFLNGGIMWNDTVIETLRNYPHAQLDLTEIGLQQYDVSTPQKKQQTAVKIIQGIKYLTDNERLTASNYIAKYAQNLPTDLMMTDRQLQTLHQSGMHIGGHTVSHPILAKLSMENAKQEISDNKHYLENLLGVPMQIFAYPNGKPDQDYLPEQAALVRQIGYQAAVSTQWDVANQNSNLWQLPRFTPWDKSPLKFMLRMILMYRQNR